MHISTQRHSRGTKLRKLILSDELKPAGSRARRDPLTLTPFCPVTSPAAGSGPLGGEHGLSPSKRTHQRSKSDATVSISLSSNLKRTASNPKVESSQDEVTAGPAAGGVHVVLYLAVLVLKVFRIQIVQKQMSTYHTCFFSNTKVF